jgi:hypothetical protein
VEPGGGVPPPPPPAPAQLVIPINPASRTITKNQLRLLRTVNGRTRIVQASGTSWSMRVIDSEFPALDEEIPVAICTMTVPVAFAAMDSLAGLELHEELLGSPLHENVKVPLDPLNGAKLSV